MTSKRCCRLFLNFEQYNSDLRIYAISLNSYIFNIFCAIYLFKYLLFRWSIIKSFACFFRNCHFCFTQSQRGICIPPICLADKPRNITHYQICFFLFFNYFRLFFVPAHVAEKTYTIMIEGCKHLDIWKWIYAHSNGIPIVRRAMLTNTGRTTRRRRCIQNYS